MKNKEKYEKAEILIQEFQTLFINEIGVTPVVMYNLSSNNLPPLRLIEIETIIEGMYQSHFPELYTKKSLRSRCRISTVVMFRFLFFKIAREMYYPLKAIGQFMGYNHASVLHAVKAIDNLLETKDSKTIKYYNLVKYEIKNRVIDNADVHDTEQQEDNT